MAAEPCLILALPSPASGGRPQSPTSRPETELLRPPPGSGRTQRTRTRAWRPGGLCLWSRAGAVAPRSRRRWALLQKAPGPAGCGLGVPARCWGERGGRGLGRPCVLWRPEHGFLLHEQSAGCGLGLQPWPGFLQGSCASSHSGLLCRLILGGC